MRYIASFVFVIGLFISLPQVTQAAFTTNDFITTWDTENTGTSASNQITIPGTGSGYSYSIYWESLSSSTVTGTIATSTSASQTITFPEAGQYKVGIKGTYPRIYFNNSGDKLKILTVEQWGSNAWTSMTSAFWRCENLTVPATDAPDLSGVTALYNTFSGATSFNNPINHWDVSSVTNMTSLFINASSFNQPLNSWDVSNVTSMPTMFNGATSFNQPLDNWNVSSVTDMTNMFRDAAAFNQPLNSWDVSNVISLKWLLLGTSFNQPLNNWNVSKATSIRAMFAGTPFNQDISMWNTASNTDLSYLFQGTPFNQDIGSWDTSNVTQMEGTFYNNDAFNYGISSWNTASTTDMDLMFFNNDTFNQDLSSWNVANVTTMTDMFKNSSLSQSNQDSTLQSWAGQSLKSNVPFHLGLKTYSSTGATALDTLRNTYNWTITEQYQAEYQDGDDYTLSGTTTQSPITSGSSTTAVEVTPDNRCTFINWSDGNTTNPRTDTLTDNLTVSATVECRNPTSGNSASSRYQKLLEFGNTTEAEVVKDKYLNTHTNTIQTAITTITALTSNPVITNNPESRQQLISLLMQLVKVLEGMKGSV